MKPALIFFDLDGTLVDSAPDIARALNATMAELGVAPLAVGQVVGYVGDGASKLVERALPPSADLAAELPDLVTRFRRHYAAGICVESRVYPGLLELLRRLADSGVRLTVLTNKPGDLARALLSALALDRFFPDVVGDGDGWPRKPDPAAANHLLARHEISATDALIVGDGLPDLRLGRAVGCRVAAAGWGYTAREVLAAERPDVFVETPADLESLLESALRPAP